MVAAQIELGAIECGLVVAGECGRSLVERTIAALNARSDLTRESLKASFASLTRHCFIIMSRAWSRVALSMTNISPRKVARTIL